MSSLVTCSERMCWTEIDRSESMWNFIDKEYNMCCCFLSLGISIAWSNKKKCCQVAKQKKKKETIPLFFMSGLFSLLFSFLFNEIWNIPVRNWKQSL